MLKIQHKCVIPYCIKGDVLDIRISTIQPDNGVYSSHSGSTQRFPSSKSHLHNLYVEMVSISVHGLCTNCFKCWNFNKCVIQYNRQFLTLVP